MTGFRPQAIACLHSGGKNGDRYARAGAGGVDSDANAGAIFTDYWTQLPADPTGLVGTNLDHRGRAHLTDASLAILYDESGTVLATQDVTAITDTGFSLSGSDLPDGNPQDVILIAYAEGSVPIHCVSVVSASANTHAHKRASVTSFRAS